MITLLIIADDFTGALDTGVQFAAYGAKTRVVTDRYYDFAAAKADVQVLVLDAETRHLDAEKAYATVFQIVRAACNAGVPYIYKKTDSALRGNIGSEMKAVMDAAGKDAITFVPAFPKMKRTTVKGMHYIDGKPVADSVFGQDPFEPVLSSDIREILAFQWNADVILHGAEEVVVGHIKPGIHLYDATTDQRLEEIAQGLGREGLHLSAGCAGFAAALVELLGLGGETQTSFQMKPSLFVACGSVNPITRRQLACAEEAGFARVQMTLPQKLDPAWLDSASCTRLVSEWLQVAKECPCMILDTNDANGSHDTRHYAQASGLEMAQVRTRISRAVGQIVKRMLDEGLSSTLVVTGGDTLMGFLDTIQISELIPVCEVAPGAVLSRFDYRERSYDLISKSGGFGEADLLLQLAKLVGVTLIQKESRS